MQEIDKPVRKPRIKRSLSKGELRELAELRRKNNLPHLYGQKFYKWSRQFFESTNKFSFLCAGNQLGKSSIQIRKVIHWATEESLWPTLWPSHPRPNTFFYLYPSRPVATTEFNEKWVPEFLPRGEMKLDAKYGWKSETKNKDIHAIHFNSGVSIYFKSYSQSVSDLQTVTLHYVAADEEVPEDLYQEIRTRLTAVSGYFSMVFTATLGQEIWRRTIEPRNETEELNKGSLKLQVSLWDCLHFEDKTKSFWTAEKISEIERNCATEAEVQKRVYGKFVISAGLKFQSFNRKENISSKRAIPSNWNIYTGVDVGTGGEKNHPAAITFIAVDPTYKKGIVFRGWRGDGVVTTSSDILEKYNELCQHEVPDKDGNIIKRRFYPVLQSYDFHSKDFFIIASRAGVGFTPADKNRERGENLLNTLFKLKMLSIMDEDPELSKLVLELCSLQTNTAKTQAVDDFCDSLRYASISIPWDFEGIAKDLGAIEEKEHEPKISAAQEHWNERRSGPMPKEEVEGVEEELDFWADMLE